MGRGKKRWRRKGGGEEKEEGEEGEGTRTEVYVSQNMNINLVLFEKESYPTKFSARDGRFLCQELWRSMVRDVSALARLDKCKVKHQYIWLYLKKTIGELI